MKSLVIFSFLITLALSKPIEIEDVGIETEDFNVDEITTSEQISEENFRSFRKPTKIRQAEIDSDAARNARFNFGYSIQVKIGESDYLIFLQFIFFSWTINSIFLFTISNNPRSEVKKLDLCFFRKWEKFTKD